MLSKDIKWHYPENIENAFSLLKEEGNFLYSGGLSINRNQSSAIKGLICVKNLDLDYICQEKDIINIGAYTNIGDFLEFKTQNPVVLYLKKAMKNMGSTPIRNRITFGGSIADFPIWSDMLGPLHALDAIVIYFDGDKKEINITEYTKNKNSLGKHIILGISIKTGREGFVSTTERLNQVRFDYPALTVNMTGNKKGNVLENVKIYITGTKNKIYKAQQAEKELTNEFTRESVEKAVNSLSPEFVTNFKYSASYKDRVSKVFLEDGLMRILEEK